jgi:hypothetical protein
LWPLNFGVPKLEGLPQCTGEAEYVNDISPLTNELFAAFVIAGVACCDVDAVDTSEAMVLKT